MEKLDAFGYVKRVAAPVIPSGVWTELAPGLRVFQETGRVAALDEPVFKLDVSMELFDQK